MASSPVACRSASNIKPTIAIGQLLVRVFIQDVGEIKKDKISKLSEALDKIASGLESQSKRMTKAEQWVKDHTAALSVTSSRQ